MKLLLLVAISFIIAVTATNSKRLQYDLILPENPFFALTQYANLKLVPTSNAVKSRFRLKSTSGYLVTKVYSGSTCSSSPQLITGRETNVCFEASNKNHNVIGSVIYQVENSKLITTEYESLDCSGDASSTTSTLIPQDKCWSNPADGSSTLITYEESLRPLKSLEPGVNVMLYNKEGSCTKSSSSPSLFEWIPLNYCFPANFGPGNSSGSIQYTACTSSSSKITLVTFSDPHCNTPIQTQQLDRPVCIRNTYGEDGDLHIDSYETLSCSA